MSHRYFTTRDRIKKKYKPKGIVALYYYYRYLIRLYTRNNTQYKLTPKMREEVKKMEEYSERIRFLCKYKIETLSNVDNVKEKKQEEIDLIQNPRFHQFHDQEEKQQRNCSLSQRRNRIFLWFSLFLCGSCLPEIANIDNYIGKQTGCSRNTGADQNRQVAVVHTSCRQIRLPCGIR